MKILDLSYNKIGDLGLEKILRFIKEDDCHLEALSLEGNSLGDKNITKLCENIYESISHLIVSINIAKNIISDESCITISNLIYKCHNLRILMLSWNNIKNHGASLIINKLKKNSEMKVLDLSWNSIGNNLNEQLTLYDIVKGAKPDKNFLNFEMNEFRSTMNIKFRPELAGVKKDAKNDPKKDAGKEQQLNPFANISSSKSVTNFAKELGEYFKENNVELIHLDISHNNISLEDAVFLSEECVINHKILGFHVDGNEMVIDELGFIHPLKKSVKEENFYANSQIYYNISQDNANNFKTNNDKIRKIRSKNNCWICEGWREIQFMYRPEESIKNNLDKHIIKLHLNFENWKPYHCSLKDGIFKCVRMCPPGEIFYFFSVDKILVENYGVHHHELREPFLYEFDVEYEKEYNENLVKNNYLENIVKEEKEKNLVPSNLILFLN